MHYPIDVEIDDEVTSDVAVSDEVVLDVALEFSYCGSLFVFIEA